MKRSVAMYFFLLIFSCVAYATPYYFNNQDKTQRYVEFEEMQGGNYYRDNTVYWYYNPVDQNYSTFSLEDTLATIEEAMESWAEHSDLKFVYKGLLSDIIQEDYSIEIAFINETDFIDMHGRYGGCAGLWWDEYKTDQREITRILIDGGYIHLNAGDKGIVYVPGDVVQLRGVITHEVGHILGLDHSDNLNSIMYVSPSGEYHAYGYQATLKDDDIRAVQELYPRRAYAINPVDGDCVRMDITTVPDKWKECNQSIYDSQRTKTVSEETDTVYISALNEMFIESLDSGWHLLGADHNLSDETIFTNVEKIWTYKSGEWKEYTPNDPASNFPEIELLDGFWMKK